MLLFGGGLEGLPFLTLLPLRSRGSCRSREILAPGSRTMSQQGPAQT